ncbi:MAG TPA: hypothetical protein VMV04_10870, partial [Thermodesulfobacteriota bacterium]|nr:hypothetical protein [Thermodesulfobacteriota bacterium]
VKGISGAWGVIFAGIKDKLSQKRLVEGGIIDHRLKFITIWRQRKEFRSISFDLDDPPGYY